MEADDAHDINLVVQMYNLIESNDNHSKKFGILQHYCKDEPAINDANGNIVDFHASNALTDSSKIKGKIAGQTDDDGTKSVEIMLLLIQRTHETPLIDCEISIHMI